MTTSTSERETAGPYTSKNAVIVSPERKLRAAVGGDASDLLQHGIGTRGRNRGRPGRRQNQAADRELCPVEVRDLEVVEHAAEGTRPGLVRRRAHLESAGRKGETEEQSEALGLHRRVGGWLEPQVDPVPVTRLELGLIVERDDGDLERVDEQAILLLESELPASTSSADEHGWTAALP